MTLETQTRKSKASGLPTLKNNINTGQHSLCVTVSELGGPVTSRRMPLQMWLRTENTSRHFCIIYLQFCIQKARSGKFCWSHGVIKCSINIPPPQLRAIVCVRSVDSSSWSWGWKWWEDRPSKSRKNIWI